jgi:hypothetical protein
MTQPAPRLYLSMAWQEPIEDDEPDTLQQLIDEIIRPRTFDEVMAEHDQQMPELED